MSQCKDCVRVDLKHEPTDVMFRAGLLAARELIAGEFNRRGMNLAAFLVRDAWWPAVGVDPIDPVKPFADDACAEALPIAMAFVESEQKRKGGDA